MRLLCLTLIAMGLLACRGESEALENPADTVAPIGTGTERLLTEERLALIRGWVSDMTSRTGAVPSSLEEIEPPPHEASRYVPLERYLRDGWGRTIHYEYRPRDRAYELRSLGEDGQLGTSDDVTVRSDARLP